MTARVGTVAFQGIEVMPVDVQVQMGGGLPNFMLVGLPDKAVGESRERVRAAQQRQCGRVVAALVLGEAAQV